MRATHQIKTHKELMTFVAKQGRQVRVFKTSVADTLVVAALKPSLDKLVGAGQWNFDLADCDKILRIVSERVEAKEAIALMNEMGFVCTELD